MTFGPLPRRHRAAFTAALLAAVLLLQWFGLVHRVAHAPQLAAVHAVEPQSAHTGQHSVFDALFGSHHSDADCQLFDQLSHADTVVSVLPPLMPALPPLAAPQVHESWHLAAQSAGYLARGPPRLA